MSPLEEKRFNAGSCLAYCGQQNGFATIGNLELLTENWTNKFGERLLEITQTMNSPNMTNRGSWWDDYKVQIDEIGKLLESELKKKGDPKKKEILRDLRDGLKERLENDKACAEGRLQPCDLSKFIGPSGGKRGR